MGCPLRNHVAANQTRPEPFSFRASLLVSSSCDSFSSAVGVADALASRTFFAVDLFRDTLLSWQMCATVPSSLGPRGHYALQRRTLFGQVQERTLRSQLQRTRQQFGNPFVPSAVSSRSPLGCRPFDISYRKQFRIPSRLAFVFAELGSETLLCVRNSLHGAQWNLELAISQGAHCRRQGRCASIRPPLIFRFGTVGGSARFCRGLLLGGSEL